MSILGHRVLRKEDPRFLRGEGLYVENLPLEGALSVTFVRSPFAHAKVNGVDVSAAAALPGVQVLTGADVDAGPFGPPPLPGIEQGMSRPLVAKDVVRFVGEIVAIVVSDGRAAGADAAELVLVDYDPLPAVVDPRVAAKDEVLLYPEVGTNVAAAPARPTTTTRSSRAATSSSPGRSSARGWRRARSSRARPQPRSARTAASPPGSRPRRPTRTGWASPARSGSTRPTCTSSPPTSAAASARRC